MAAASIFSSFQRAAADDASPARQPDGGEGDPAGCVRSTSGRPSESARSSVIREAREVIGATDRSLALLNALLSFHSETALGVGPSNEQLAARASGRRRPHGTAISACSSSVA
ncbi:helix-turn-helix domain-containing protein [Ancylobacter dichloromethanicus]|uniref:helix-turn-helix domain-containing protein n=1 Tax=Ancylobacter dichloromethanicus TaxID=518825 RepID=UPI002852C28B|nr:helix-turn-helix domain-containing protein [Ancylobacter dichloromethanicus]